MAKSRINFGVSDFVRNWILIQPNVTGVAEQSDTHFTFYHEMTGPQKVAFRNGFLQMLIEEDVV